MDRMRWKAAARLIRFAIWLMPKTDDRESYIKILNSICRHRHSRARLG